MATVTPSRAPKIFSMVEEADGTPVTITPCGQEGPNGGVLVGGGGGCGGGRPPPVLVPPPRAQPVTDNNSTTNSSLNDTTTVASSTASGATPLRFDFSSIQVRGVQDLQNIQTLHDVYSHVQHHSNTISSNPNNDSETVTGTTGISEFSRKKSFIATPKHRERKRQHHHQDPTTTTATTTTTTKSGEMTSTSTTSSTNVVMIKGVSGTGKNTLVKKFIQEVNVQSKLRGGPKKPYFITGKCDELSVGDPYSAIVEAFNGFVTTILTDESTQELERIQTVIQDVIGYETAQALITFIPNLEHVIVKKQQTNTTSLTSTSSRSTTTGKGSQQHNYPSNDDKDLNKKARVNGKDDNDEEKEEEERPIVVGSKENAWNRLKYLFQVFTNAISTKERPVIMFLDDLQWCDDASFELLEALLSDLDLEYLMFIGAYRDDELVVSQPGAVSVVTTTTGKNHPQEQAVQEQEHILLTTMKNIERNTGQTLKMIHLVNMTYTEFYDFVSNVLLPTKKQDQEQNDHHFDEKVKNMKPLVDVIYRKTSGNIFFTVQVMEELQRKGILSFSRKTTEWEWDLEMNIETLNDLLSDDVLEAISSKLSSAPVVLQQALILAAYTRSTVDIDTLQQLLELENTTRTIPSSSNTATTSSTTTSITSRKELLKLLDKAVADGLLSNSMGSKSYSFAHDRVQQASYAMVPTGPERDDFRMKMGLRLYELGQKKTKTKTTTTKSGGESRSGGGGEDWMLFVAADHLNATADLVQTTLGSMFLVKLNLEVGRQAESVAAYETASTFLGLAIQGLLKGVKDPWRTEYETTLLIYRCIVDVELCQGHLEVGSGIGERIFKHAKTSDDKLPTQVSLGRALGRGRKHREAFELGIKSLRAIRQFPRGFVGVHLGLAKDLLYVKKYFKKNSNRDILRLPSMTDERLLQAMDLLETTAYQAFQIGKEIEFVAATLRMLRITFKHGLCGQSGVGMMGWTLILDKLKDMEGVKRFSKLARDILRITKAKEHECLQLFVCTYFINSWKDLPDEVLEIYHQAHQSGMESGDFENGHLCLTASYHHEFLAGYSLLQLDDKYASLMEKLDLYKVDSVKVMTIEQWLEIQHLRGSAEAPLDFETLESSYGSGKHDGSELYQLMYGCMARIKLGVYFGHCEFAETYIQKITPLLEMDTAHGPNSVNLFFGSLIYSTLARENKKQRRSYQKKAQKYADELKVICKVKGKNSYHRYLLAEAHHRAGSDESGDSAQKMYDRAIEAALMSEHENDAALGSQLAAEHFLGICDEVRQNAVLARSRKRLVRQYLKQARDWYLQWGARGLVRHLEQIYNEYLDPTPESVAEESTNADVISCCEETFNSMDLGNSNSDPGSSFRSMPQIVSNKLHGDEVSVMTDLESPWRKKSTFTNPHTTDGDYSTTLLDALDELDG